MNNTVIQKKSPFPSTVYLNRVSAGKSLEIEILYHMAFKVTN
jgi:hypothetical protein